MPKGRRSDTWPRWAAVTSRDSISQTLPAPRSVPYRGTEVTQPRHFVTVTELRYGRIDRETPDHSIAGRDREPTNESASMTPYLAELAIEAGTVIGSCRCPMRQADGSVSCSI